MFTNSFPKKLSSDAEFVAGQISSENCPDSDLIFWKLRNGEEICFPYRVYFEDKIEVPKEIFTPAQETVYHCIFSRSCDGYIREKNIKALLENDIPEWVVPYIIKVCEEYVLKILELIYDRLAGTDTSEYKEICKLNSERFVRGYDRMVSYWNEYHRDKCSNFCNYVGRKLYEECFGFERSMYKKCN